MKLALILVSALAGVLALALVAVIGAGGSLTGESGDDRPDAFNEPLPPESDSPPPPEEDPFAEDPADWCTSEESDRFSQVTSRALGEDDPAEVKRLQDRALRLARKAPDGADCVGSDLYNAFINHWNAYISDPATRRYNPRRQVKIVRRFMRERDFPAP